MSKKVTKEKFIQAIVNNEDGLTNEELAESMGISKSYFYDLRREYRVIVRDKASELAQGIAIEQVHNLARNARKGDTQAAKTLLEMAGSYIPSSRQKLEVDASNLGVIVVPEKKPVGAPVDDAREQRDDKTIADKKLATKAIEKMCKDRDDYIKSII